MNFTKVRENLTNTTQDGGRDDRELVCTCETSSDQRRNRLAYLHRPPEDFWSRSVKINQYKIKNFGHQKVSTMISCY